MNPIVALHGRRLVLTRSRQADLWAMNLSPWRYAAFMACGLTAGLSLGQWLPGTDHSLTERALQIGSIWLMSLFVYRLVARFWLQTLRQQQQWRDERREGKAMRPRS